MKNFNTELDKDIFESNIHINVYIYNKNEKLFKQIQYSSGYSIDEVFKLTQRDYNNKIIRLELINNNKTK